ncbi:MAG: CBS domain-containing protein [Bacteroidota bacterium]
MKSIREIVTGKQQVYSVQMDMTVLDAVKYMAEKRIGAVPVVDGTRLVGIFSERDVITRVIAKGLRPDSTKVSEVMTTNLVVATEDESYESCLRKMKQASRRHLPIVARDSLKGVLSLRDLLMVDINEKDEKIEFLQSYLFHLPPDAQKRYQS